MSSYYCEQCGAEIIDTSRWYITGCAHYPLNHLPDASKKVRASRDYTRIQVDARCRAPAREPVKPTVTLGDMT